MGAVQPLTSAAPLGGTEVLDDCRLQADSLDDVLQTGPGPRRTAMRRVVHGWMILIGWFHLMIWTL